MQLEEYFEFEKFDTKHGPVEKIRFKGSRIGIEIIVGDYKNGASPERIQSSYSTLTLEQVYAAITYYLHNAERVEAYIREGDRIGDAYYREWQENPSPVVQKLLRVKAERAKASGAQP